jgi:hypothetical protein
MGHKKKSNLQLAKSAVQYTLKCVVYSSNRVSKEDPVMQQGLDKMRVEMAECKAPAFSLPWIDAMARLARKYECGNCNEKAAVAFMYIKQHVEKNPQLTDTPRIELFNNPFLDHFWIVLGRPAESLEYDQSTWIGATICDPWDEDSFYINSREALLRLQKEEKPSLLSPTDALEKTVISVASPTHLDITKPVVGLLRQKQMVLRHQLNYCKLSGRYVEGERCNVYVPLTYDAEIDFNPLSPLRYKRGYAMQIASVKGELYRVFKKQGFFSQKKLSDGETQPDLSKEVTGLVCEYLYPPRPGKDSS